MRKTHEQAIAASHIAIGEKIYVIADWDGRPVIDELTVTEVGVGHIWVSAFFPPKGDLGKVYARRDLGSEWFLCRKEAEQQI